MLFSRQSHLMLFSRQSHLAEHSIKLEHNKPDNKPPNAQYSNDKLESTTFVQTEFRRTKYGQVLAVHAKPYLPIFITAQVSRHAVEVDGLHLRSGFVCLLFCWFG